MFERLLRVRTRRTGAILGPLCVTVLVGWTAFDRVLVPHHAQEFLVVRVLAGSAAFVCWLTLVIGPPGRLTEPAAFGILAPVQIGVAWMLPRLSGELEAYLLGLSLAIYASAVFMVWRLRWTVAIATLTLVSIAVVQATAPQTLSSRDLAVAAFYLGTAMVIALVGHALRLRADHAEFSARERERKQRETNSQLMAQLELLSRLDPLTSVSNRRAFDLALVTEHRRAVVDGSTLGLVMVDLDSFKVLNDTRGHQAGDVALQAVAAALTHEVRPGDLVARFGGDEFVILLPRVDPDDLPRITRRLTASVVTALDHDAREAGVGISAGHAAFPRDADHPEGLVRAADQSLYAEKRARGGRTSAFNAQA